MAIDDPGVLNPGQWELIAAVTATKSSSGDKAYELPIAGISVGLSENIQISASYPWIVADTDENRSSSDFGNLSVGLKWRFVNTDRLQIAFAPGYARGVTLSAARLGIGDDSDIGFLPLNFEYGLGGEWTLNGEIGYAIIDESEDEWAYGLAIGHPIGRRTQLMFEVYGATNSKFDDRIANFHLGVDVELTTAWHLLASFGAGVHSPKGAEHLDYDAFLGMQYFTHATANQ